MDIVAENPGATIEEMTELAADMDIPDVLSVAVSNDDLLEFDDRYWVMRKGSTGSTDTITQKPEIQAKKHVSASTPA
ncbi:hypothetical protein Htur_4070 (plasmid) [Haloterrigena turkmenica DSM 5511]|uniref:Uncharacterized protein n=1 Tax=Haloterrigena turkmenica (strain ATCC 51198 / DSM 5511 / JCM 9101 / NCIMB 13204 / VKM B-1734 / 4k) TaxID=543526 RepID=D2S0L1_HALTV|nr:hypothetical protein [Haloterrigena turkmenica]ADB62908.1 hypothetical protein Htur_4070 [Haloterrigena turkmenica DSM 5511]